MSRQGNSLRLSLTEATISNNTDIHCATPPQRPSWQALWPVLRFGLCTLLLSLLLSLFVTPIVNLSWLQAVRRCVSIAAAASLFFCVYKLERKSLRSYGLLNAPAGKKQLFLGLLFGIIALGIMLATGLLTGNCAIEIHPDPFRLWRTVIGFAPAAILVSVLEELVFRGFLLQQLSEISRFFGFMTSSGLYAIVHLKQRSLTGESWMELTGLFLLGALLAWSYFLTGKLWLGIGLHASLAYGARVNKLLIAFSDSSQSWLVGTSRLVDGLSSWLALLIVGILLWSWVKWMRKRGVVL